MARRVRDADLESRAARGKLKPSGKPYYRAIGRGLHLGYRKGATVGKWVCRRYVGDQDYKVETIATADDIEDSNGENILTFWQAQDRARALVAEKVYSGPYRAKDAIGDYLLYLGDQRNFATGLRAKKHILPSLGDELVEQLTADRLREWHRGLVRAGQDEEIDRKSRVSANRVLTILKAAFNHAFAEGKVATDSEWRRVKPFKGVARSRTRYLTYAEIERLLNAAAPHFRPLVRGALETGARYGELQRMVCGDFNPDAGTIHVKKSKTGKERHIILTDDGTEFFAKLTLGQLTDAPMFGKAWRADEQFRWMNLACENGKIEPRMNFHGLRHTYASLSIMGGVPLHVVAANLGHVDTKMVERHYGHLAPSYKVDAIRKHGPRFGSVAGGNVARLQGGKP
jgi:integrase